MQPIVPKAGLVLLAAGDSQRMGATKQLLEIGGTPMFRIAATAALASCCRPVVAVCGANAVAVRASAAGLPLRFADNPEWRRGIGTSIRAGISTIEATDADAAIIALADQPLIGAQVFDRLVQTYLRQRCAVVASEYDGTLGAPALFDRRLFPELLALRDDEGCKRVILSLPQDVVERVPCPEAKTDVDTPEEYASLAASVVE